MDTRVSVVALAVCASSDLAAVPLLLGSDDVPSGVGIGVAALGLLTLLAAFGVNRGTVWARPLAFGTRAVDVVAAVPALLSGNAGAITIATAAAGVTVVLSVLTIGLMLRHEPHTIRTA